MLSEQEKREIEAHVSVYSQPRGGVIEALKIVQKRHRWIDEEKLGDIAALLKLTVEEVEAVATTYDRIYRKPVGRHVILICDNVSCWLTGEPALRETLGAHLGVKPGEITPDGRFTFLPIACLGACEMAPVMMVDDDLHGNLTPEKLKDVLSRYE